MKPASRASPDLLELLLGDGLALQLLDLGPERLSQSSTVRMTIGGAISGTAPMVNSPG
jgi:hypothetical protein